MRGANSTLKERKGRMRSVALDGKMMIFLRHRTKLKSTFRNFAVIRLRDRETLSIVKQYFTIQGRFGDNRWFTPLQQRYKLTNSSKAEQSTLKDDLHPENAKERLVSYSYTCAFYYRALTHLGTN